MADNIHQNPASPAQRSDDAPARRLDPEGAACSAPPEEPHELELLEKEAERKAERKDSAPAARPDGAKSAEGAQGAEAAEGTEAEKAAGKTEELPAEPPAEKADDLLGSWKMTLFILTSASVLMSMSYTMLIPFLPMYLLQELHVPQEDVNLWSGLVFSISFLISGIMAPVWGAMADKRSRKMMAVRAAVLLSVSYGLGGIVQNEWQLFAMRGFQGFAAGLWPACLAILSSSVPKTKLGFSLGTMQGGMTAGGVIGPLMGGVLAEGLGMRATFFLGSAALFVIALLIIFKIKEPKKKKTHTAPGTGVQRPKTNLLRIPVVQRMLVTAGVVQMTILFQQPVMPLYVAELQGSMDRIVLVTGVLFSAVGLSGVFASPLWGIAGQKWGYRPALYLALLGSGIFGIVQAIPNDLWQFGIWRFVGGLAFAGIFPAINAVLTNSTDPEDRGRIFGLSYAAQQAGSVAGPIVGGALGMWFGLKFVVFFSGLVLLPMLAWLYLKRPKTETSSAGKARRL